MFFDFLTYATSGLYNLFLFEYSLAELENEPKQDPCHCQSLPK